MVIAGGPWQDDRDSKVYRDRVLMSLKDRGVEVYSVGVGSDTSSKQMSDISSGRRYWFLPKSYDDLANVRPRLIQSIQGRKYKWVTTCWGGGEFLFPTNNTLYSCFLIL